MFWSLALTVMAAGGCHQRRLRTIGRFGSRRLPIFRGSCPRGQRSREAEPSAHDPDIRRVGSPFGANQGRAAPDDLFLSANESFPRNLARMGLIVADSVRLYARGTLVLCLHRGVTSEVRGLTDLSRPEITKIAIANPDYAVPMEWPPSKRCSVRALVCPRTQDCSDRLGASSLDPRARR